MSDSAFSHPSPIQRKLEGKKLVEAAKREAKERTLDRISEETGVQSPTNCFFDSEPDAKKQSVADYECSDRVSKSSQRNFPSKVASPKALIKELEAVYATIQVQVPKRDRLHNNLLKALRKYLQEDFKMYCSEFAEASNSERVANYDKWLTGYIREFFGEEIEENFNESIYGGKWKGLQFIFGSFISRETMKQMISSSREKAYFYGLQKCFKNSSQKKLAIMLKNVHLVHLLEFLFSSDKIRDVLKIE